MSQDRVYAVLVGLIVGMAVLIVSSQSMAEDSSAEVQERIRPVGQVRIEGQTNSSTMAPAPAMAPTPAATETSAAATEPVAKAEPAAAPAATQQAAAAPAPSTSDGAALYAAKGCAACHGADGNLTTMPTYPKLAGQSADYAYNQMMDIKSGARSSGQAIVMKGIIAQVSKEEIRIIADWLGGL